MNILRSVNAASRQIAALSMVLLAIAGVSAAPKGHTVALRTQALAENAVAAKSLPKARQHPPVHSVKALTEHIAFLKKWGKDHNTRVKTGYLEAYLFRMQHLAYPNDRVDWAAYAGGVAQRDRLPAANFGPARGPVSATALAQRWDYVGPNSLQVPYRIYYGQGTTSGRVNALAYDPNVSSTYWLGSAGGGVWKSTNNGQAWTFLSQSWPALEVSAIATHPTDSNTVYVGTGDFHGYGGYGFGIMKTTDGGATWTNLGRAEMGNFAVSDIIVDPENPQTVIAAAGRGRSGLGQVWRSTNGGVSWSAVITATAEWSGLSLGPRDTMGVRNLYAVGHQQGGLVYRSQDRGATWTALTTPLTNVAGTPQIGLDIAASQITPGTAYLLSGTDRLIHRTTDAGATWTSISAGFPNDLDPGDNYNWSQSTYDYHIATSVNGTSDVVYVGLIDLVASPDGGTTWTSVGATYTAQALSHNDQHCVAINPRNPNEVLVGNDGGVYRMSYTPSTGTATFNTTLNARLGITQFYKADYHPSDPTRMIGGTQDNATPVALGDLSSWRNVCGGDGCGCAINPANPNIQYASAQFQSICRTADQWTTTTDITPDWGNDRLPFIGRLILDPSRPNLMYAGTNYLWRWNDSTQNWTPRLGGAELASGQGTILSIAVAPSDGNVIYTGSSTGDLYMTTNGGTTWTSITTGTPNLPNRSILAISIHPTNPRNILVGLSGSGPHLWRCLDTSVAARAWTNISSFGASGLPDVPVNAVVIDPVTPNSRYYVATDVGVFRSTNAGTSWENATAPLNLPNVMVNDLKIAGTGYLMAATFGRGIWRIDPQASVTRLTVTSPNGGEAFVVNQPTTIRWTTLGFAAGHTVKLELSRDGGTSFPEVIAAAAPDTGTFDWTPQLPVSATCQIRITSTLDSSVSDTSDANFSIVQGSLTVNSPNGGELVRFGQTHRIRWTSTDFALTSPLVRIELSRDGGANFSELLFSGVSNSAGQIDWVVTGPATTSARIRVTAATQSVFTDDSDANFEIREPSVINLQRPNGGEAFVTNTPVTILWTSAGFAGDVRIEASRNGGGAWEVLFPSTPNDGAEVWTVAGASTRFGRIRIVSLAEPTVTDRSDGVFSVEAPTLITTGPANGSNVLLGQEGEVTWTTTGLSASSNVKIELSRDGGATWAEELSGAAPNSGSYIFTATGEPTTNARVRVTSVDYPEIRSVSGQFSLAVPSIFLVAPVGGERWAIGDQRIIEWSGTAVGTGSVEIQLSRNGGKRWETIVEDTPSDGAQAWGVRGALSSKTRIRVIWYSPTGGTLVAESRKNFQIVRPAKKKKKR
ncbi:MAG: hypothetical protein ACO1SX_26320 [Actinomycetota bacterium]